MLLERSERRDAEFAGVGKLDDFGFPAFLLVVCVLYGLDEIAQIQLSCFVDLASLLLSLPGESTTVVQDQKRKGPTVTLPFASLAEPFR